MTGRQEPLQDIVCVIYYFPAKRHGYQQLLPGTIGATTFADDRKANGQVFSLHAQKCGVFL